MDCHGPSGLAMTELGRHREGLSPVAICPRELPRHPIKQHCLARHTAQPAYASWRSKFRMEQRGLAPKDLEPFIGPSGRVSEVLNRKRPLSLRMVRRLHEGLNIPYESLLSKAT